VRVQEERHREERADHQHVAVGEIHQADGPKDDREAERDQRVHRAHAQPADARL